MNSFPPLWSDEVEARVRAEARNLDTQERPEHVQFCTRCVVSNQRPRIQFDSAGVCSACRYAERKNNGDIDWVQRAAALDALLDKHRRSSGYDVIVPCSGGKDSAMIAHRLKHEYGMHPLCVKWAPFMYTDIGRRNWERFGHEFDLLECTPRRDLHRKLARLAFEYYGDPFQPFVYGQLAWPMHVAAKFGIPLVMFGENGEAEYGGDPAANDSPAWDYQDWERVYSKDVGVHALVLLGQELGAISDEERRSLSPFYRVPAWEQLNSPQFHWFSYYRRWHPQENFDYATKHTGFEKDERSEGTYTTFASLDDKLDGLHYYMAYIKFGIGRATSDAAQQVRDENCDVNREDAVLLVKRYDGECPERHLDECLDYLGMDGEHLHTVINRFRNTTIWENSDFGQTFNHKIFWLLKHQVWRSPSA